MRLQRRRRLVLVLATAVAFGQGCAGSLVPTEDAMLDMSGPGTGAFSTARGVRVEARSGGWSGSPALLARALTPLFVEIENRSDRDLAIHFGDFVFLGTDNRRWVPMPPFALDEQDLTVPIEPAYNPRGFRVAPYLRGFYPYGRYYDGVFAYDRAYYSQYYAEMHERNIDLPTPDMLEQALAEGVVEPNGTVSGFVYFEKVDEASDELRFRLDLVDAASGERLGAIEIPFRLN